MDSPKTPVRPLPPVDVKALGNALAAWFAVHQRPLPWRSDRSAYRVWLSEIMLQQTQVAVVERYFAAFTEKFPTVVDLANASEDAVLAMWAGLGYYARGRNLHRAAKMVRDDFGGQFPTTAATLMTLPGVGRYTAGAIATFAFGERTPIVDGNIFRVLARVWDDATPVNHPAGVSSAWERAASLVAEVENPRATNEALMELGALVCTPRNPKCDRCPVSTHCRSHAAGTTAERPVKLKAAARTKLTVAMALLVTDDDRVWLEKQPSTGLFGGLYAPPSQPVEGRTRPATVVKTLFAERGIPFTPKPGPIVVDRTLTHRDLTFLVFARRVVAPTASAEWVPRAELPQWGLAAAARAVLDAAWPAGPQTAD